MEKDKLLEGKRILLVDDEPDVLDTLEDLLPMCITTKASGGAGSTAWPITASASSGRIGKRNTALR
jgi:CheY-like chemotaxis protein